MRIGFDAKRAYHNDTGLGHYSRNLIHSLARHYPQHCYYLFNPKPSGLFKLEGPSLQEVLPRNFLHKIFSSAWRSKWVKADLARLEIDLYHGLSHEIPLGIQHTKVKSVVTMHDLIHERYPEQYKAIDVRIYRSKFKNACKHADRVIAITEQTKRDLIDFYGTPEDKISICYPACNVAYGATASEEEKQRVKRLYGLPDRFFLYVGSVIERKNLLNICKAVFLLRHEMDIPLVVIGNGGGYKQLVKDYVLQQGLEKKVLFLSDSPAAKSSQAFQTSADFPAIYQQALAMIYPSVFEGFGLPVLEALWSRIPVITSNVSCLPETGGDAAYYVDPYRAEEIAEGMTKIAGDEALVASMIAKGWQHAQRFTNERHAEAVMQVYQSLF
jgi:glycosyltransferase involved in cell wall biosynthesis